MQNDNVTFALSELQAWGVCILLSACYVGALYLMPSRLRSLSRDNPSQIKARFVCVACSTAFAIASLSWLATPSAQGAPLATWIGLPPSGANETLVAVTLPLALTASLFLGPLVCLALITSLRRTHEWDSLHRWRPLERQRSLVSALLAELADRSGTADNPLGVVRNLVVGPVSEEVVFRGCFLPPLLASGVRRNTAICLSPFIFGLAHFHHLGEKLRQGHSLAAAVLPIVFQTFYTAIFGAFAAFVHVRTNHLLAPIACHVFCNFMGLPDFSFTQPLPGHLGCGPLAPLYPRRRLIWNAYIAGIVLFSALLGPLTSPALFGSYLWYVAAGKAP
ncbi:unnamed protein product [Phaeothamnion confervicola]